MGEYYMLNCAAKKGFNMSSIFGVVHAANMAKRNPETGRFEKNADGKVIKPPGWKPPDVEGELARQVTEGSWCQSSLCSTPDRKRLLVLEQWSTQKEAEGRLHVPETGGYSLQKPEL